MAPGETGWPSCGAARAFPYSFATLPYAERFVKNVANWIPGCGVATMFLRALITDRERETFCTPDRHVGISFPSCACDVFSLQAFGAFPNTGISHSLRYGFHGQ